MRDKSDCRCGDCMTAFFMRYHNLGIIDRPDKSIPDCIPLKPEKTWWDIGGLHSGRFAAMSSPIDKYKADLRLATMLDRDFPIEGHSRVAHIK